MIELSKYLQDEQAAENYLYEKGILKKFTECPHCGSDKIGHVSRGRIKCYKCKKEWHKRKGSFLEGKQISCSKFIAFLKLYSDEIGVNKISSELNLDIKSIIELHTLLRTKIIHSYYSLKPDISSKYILYIIDHKIMLQTQKKFSGDEHPQSEYMLVNFDRTKEYGNLYSFLIRAEWVGTRIKYKSMLNTFISYVKMKLISYRGIKVEYFFDFFLELIIKFNSRDKIFYEKVLEFLRNSKGG
jgi:transposase